MDPPAVPMTADPLVLRNRLAARHPPEQPCQPSVPIVRNQHRNISADRLAAQVSEYRLSPAIPVQNRPRRRIRHNRVLRILYNRRQQSVRLRGRPALRHIPLNGDETFYLAVLIAHWRDLHLFVVKSPVFTDSSPSPLSRRARHGSCSTVRRRIAWSAFPTSEYSSGDPRLLRR